MHFEIDPEPINDFLKNHPWSMSDRVLNTSLVLLKVEFVKLEKLLYHVSYITATARRTSPAAELRLETNRTKA